MAMVCRIPGKLSTVSIRWTARIAIRMPTTMASRTMANGWPARIRPMPRATCASTSPPLLATPGSASEFSPTEPTPCSLLTFRWGGPGASWETSWRAQPIGLRLSSTRPRGHPAPAVNTTSHSERGLSPSRSGGFRWFAVVPTGFGPLPSSLALGRVGAR